MWPHVLVVDDEPAYCNFIEGVVEEIGGTARTASGRQDILAALQHRYDAIFVDLTMPEFDGIEVIRVLAETQCQTPLFMISGFSRIVLGHAATLARSSGLNVVDVLEKPILIEQIEAALERLRPKANAASAAEAVINPGHGQDSGVRQTTNADAVIPQFQPQIDAQTGAVTGLQAMMRETHPERDLLPPEQLTPRVINDSDIAPVTLRFLQQILTYAQIWQTIGPSTRVAFAVDTRVFDDPTFIDAIERRISDSGRPAEQFTIEVSEAALRQASPMVLRNLYEARARGLGIAIQDFGVGGMTVARLGDLPVTQVKIDRSLTQNLASSDKIRSRVAAMIDLAHTLGITVVANGVKTQSQVTVLRQFLCDQVQGSLFCQPLPPAALVQWLRERAATLAGSAA